MLRLKRTIVN